MSKKMFYLISFVLVLSLTYTGYGQVLIGNWENVMDGWLIDPCAPPGTTTSYSATGVTLGAKSLKLTVPQGGWKQALYIPLDDRGLVNSFFDNDVFSLDITRLAAEWTGAPSNGWSNFHVIINANSALGPVWIDLGADNSAWTYRDANGTSTTYKWDYATAKARIDKASVSNLDLILVSNYDPNYTSGGVYYLDKARLEPRSYLNVIGNFEHVMDGWVAGWEGSPVFAYASTGATLDGNSLSVKTNGGYWCLSWNAPVVPTSLKGVTLKFDLTMIASEWEPNRPWTKVADKIGLNSDVNQPGRPDGWKEYNNLAKAINRTTGNPTSLDWGAWSGDAKKTYSLDISNYNVTGATWFRISISIQHNNSASGHFYFDNVRLSSAGPAYGPNPANNEREVPTDAALNWKPGLFADKHDVYFGTDKTKVDSANRNNPLGVLREQNYDPNTYSPGELAGGETYYWRIDEVNESGPDPCSWKGDVWNFTTVYPPPGVVIGDWEDNMDGWVPDQGNPTLSYSTTGATLNEKSLKIEVGSAWYWVITLTLSPAQIEALKANDIISLDVTWVTSEWTGGSWAQVPGISINAAGIGWNQVDPPTGDTSNPGNPGYWDPYNFGEIDTRTITWNYKDSDINNVANIPEGGYCYLQFATQYDAGFATGTYYFDNARFLDSRVASNPNPQDRATNVQTEPTLSWKPGKNAKKHDVYFGTDYDFVKDANRTNDPYDVLVKQDHDTNSIDIANDVGVLEFETNYFWRIDEVNGVDIRKGGVWKFTTGRYLIVDDFESYNPSLANTWKTGGKAKVSLSTDPVHGEKQAMAIDYNNNNPTPYYSEAYANTTGPDSLDFGTDWTMDGVEGLSLWFRGYPDVRGSFAGSGPYTLNAAGWDIEDMADGFHYAYKVLTTITWQITAKVLSVEDTGDWAKAGIMVRRTLEPDSMNAAVVVTPGNGVGFQYRESNGGDTTSIITPGFTPPHWVRLTRGDVISAEHANDVGGNPDKWTQIGGTLDLALSGSPTPIYIGLCVTSHDELELCTASFSNVSMLKSFPPGTAITTSWADKDIGIPYNAPEKMYVVLKDGNSDWVVYHSDPNVTQTGTWTHWGIELDEFSAHGVTLTDVQRMYIGFGNRGTPVQDGTGKVFIDDIRLYAPGCVLSNRTAGFAKADYAPEGDPSGDCVVDYREIGIMGRDWLKSPPPNPAVDLRVDNKIDFRDFAALAEFWLEEQISLWP